ncbi:MAG TPA: hypothetical protein VHD56_08535 [Tepidisphaeraceae bacterium]|nr:hypothetical protein [Tepidisphaeraceae bacterium]
MKHIVVVARTLALSILLTGVWASAATVVINPGDGGWTNGDTRDATGVNVDPAPGRLDLNVSPPGGVSPSGNNVLRLVTDTGSAKATLQQSGVSLGNIANFSGSYTWYKENAGAAAPAFKLGIDTTDSNPTSSRPGEALFDKFLVYEPYDNPDSGDPGTGVWVNQSFSLNSGGWWLVDRTAGNIQVNPPYSSLTLNQWLSDATYGTRLSGGNIVAIQIGQGSGNAGLTSYVDSAAYTYGVNALSESYVFGEPTPEPASLTVISLAGALFIRRGRK